MTEQKKDYIMDALSELEDGFIAEAAEYVKSRATWKYWRELGAAAACVVAVAMTVTTLRYLPIGMTAESTAKAEMSNQYTGNSNEAAMEGATAESAVTQECADEEVKAAEANGSTASNEGNNVIEKENASVAVDKIENLDHELVYSQGIEWEIIEEQPFTQDGIGQTEESKTECWEITEQPGTVTEEPETGTMHQGIMESIQTSSCVSWLSAEEIFAKGNDIFMGIVTDMQIYHVSGKMDKYFTVATVEVKDSIRGERAVGDSCRIYLPLAEVNGMVSTNSLVGDLMKLEIGSSAIFMPMTATADTGLGKQDVGEWLCYADFADYYFSEGMRYLFLATEDGVSYEEDVYEIPGEEITLVEVAEYIRKMLAEE